MSGLLQFIGYLMLIASLFTLNPIAFVIGLVLVVIGSSATPVKEPLHSKISRKTAELKARNDEHRATLEAKLESLDKKAASDKYDGQY